MNFEHMILNMMRAVLGKLAWMVYESYHEFTLRDFRDLLCSQT